MERNGDVVAELSNCGSPNCALIQNRFNTGKYKMCKDDIVIPLFCSASNHVESDLMMDSHNLSPESYLNSDGHKMGINFFSSRKNGVNSNQHTMPIIESSVDSLMSNLSSPPAWEKPPHLQSFSPISQKVVEKLYVQDSYINGSKIQPIQNQCPVTESSSILRTQNSSGLLLGSSDIINRKLLLDYEAETSSSSIEDAFSLVDKNCEPSKTIPIIAQTIASSVPNSIISKSAVIPNVSSECNLNQTKLPKSNSKANPNCPVKNDRVMPELLPTLICLDDEDSIISEKVQKKCEVIDVASSPEMPILIPFTSEVDEAFRVKTEAISDTESKHTDSDSLDSADAVRQPKIVLQRITVNCSSFPKEEKPSTLLSSCLKNELRKGITEGPEIEEIEGVRFFQFRSKQEMEEFKFNRFESMDIDLDMIVPTKTNDITQIKGWRNKYFAPENFHSDSFDYDVMKTDDSSQDSKVSVDQNEENQNTKDNSETRSSGTSNSESKNSSVKKDSDSTKENSNKKDSVILGNEEEKVDIKKVKIENVDKISSPKSAFISEKLDQYLSNSSTLNVSFLQRVNPNIIPISNNASILSLGKLRKTDSPRPSANLIFKRKREFINLEKLEADTSDSVITLADSPESPNIITLGSSPESSSEEDIPVAKLKSKKPFIARKKALPNKGLKRKNLAKEFEQASKRVVLRLRKDGDGVSKGYKVSDISCTNEKYESSSSDISFDSVDLPEDGSLPIIKSTLFSKRKEPELLDEFLNNLNMYGTRKDVAMLVQSNQSYFNEGPILSPKTCTKAISVLFSNKIFMDFKQKSKKRKLKTWQKYLPKKLTDMQKMKFKKRKTRVQSLLDDAENIISAERRKRSIRLPARYLDSAVLAAGSEWVSPIITIDDNASSKKSRKPTDVIDKRNKHKSPEFVSSSESSDSSSESTTSSSSSESSVSSESDVLAEKAIINLSSKSLPKGKDILDYSQIAKQKSLSKKRDILKQKIPRSPSKNVSEPSLKNKSENMPKTSPKNKLEKASETAVDDSSASSSLGKGSTAVSKTYIFPNCSCKHSSRTASLDIKTKKFSCIYCINKNMSTISSCNSSVIEKNCKLNVSKADECVSNAEDTKLHIKNNELLSNVARNSTSSLVEDNLKPVNCDIVSTKSLELSNLTTENHQNKLQSLNSGVTLEAINLSTSSNLQALPNKEKLNITANESVNNIPINVPPSSVSKNFIFLLTPVQNKANVNNTSNVPSIPILPKINSDEIECGKILSPDQRQKVITAYKFGDSVFICNRAPVMANSDKKSPTSIISPSFISSSNLNGPIKNVKESISPTVSNTNMNLPTISSVQSNAHLTIIKEGIISATTVSNTVKSIKENVISPTASNVDMNLPTISSVQSNAHVKILKEGLISTTVSNTSMSLPTISSVQSNAHVKIIKESIISPTFSNTNMNLSPGSSVQQNSTAKNINEGVKSSPIFQSQILPNGLAKWSYVSPYRNSSTIIRGSSESAPSSADQVLPKPLELEHQYHKKILVHRRKSPLSTINCKEDDNERLEIKESLDSCGEVDIESVDNSCEEFINKELIIDVVRESDSDLSDNECANIFNSSADHLASIYAKKSISERKRRLLIKSGFENLKASSKSFKDANTCLEILQMANFVIASEKEKEELLMLGKKRLQVHNTMLLDKLVKLLEGIEPLSNKIKIKNQVIQHLALDRKKYKRNKSMFPSSPLLSKQQKKEKASLNFIQEKKKSTSDALEIDFSKQNIVSVSQKQNLQSPEDVSCIKEAKEVKSLSSLLADNQCNENKQQRVDSISSKMENFQQMEDLSCIQKPKGVKSLSSLLADNQCHELKKLLESPSLTVNLADDNEPPISPKPCIESTNRIEVESLTLEAGKIKIDEMRKKVKSSLLKSPVPTQTASDSDTENLDSSSTSDSDSDGIEICDVTDDKTSNVKSSVTEESTKSTAADKHDKPLEKNYPGLIPLFHPKVFKENFSRCYPPSNTLNFEESSHNIQTTQNLRRSVTNVTSLGALNLVCNDDEEEDGDEVSIIGSKIVNHSHTNTSPVFKSNSDTSAQGACSDTTVSAIDMNVTRSSSGVRNLTDAFHASTNAKSDSNQKKWNVPEEIVISDSDEETSEHSVSEASHVPPSTDKVGNSGDQRQIHSEESDSDDDRMHIDESYSPNRDNSSL